MTLAISDSMCCCPSPGKMGSLNQALKSGELPVTPELPTMKKKASLQHLHTPFVMLGIP